MRLRLRGRNASEGRPETLTPDEVVAVLEARSQELLGVSGDQAIEMAKAGELPDDLAGSIVGSWVMMARGVRMHP